MVQGSIRKAVKKDIPDILNLLEQVDMVHHRGRPDLFKGPATKYNAAQLENILSDPETPVLVFADKNDRVLGHAFCVHRRIVDHPVLTDIRTLYIDDICVDESFRGQGIGRRLYLYVLEYAKSLGFYNITLNVWSCNPGAMQFYTSLGLTPQKTGLEKVLQG